MTPASSSSLGEIPSTILEEIAEHQFDSDSNQCKQIAVESATTGCISTSFDGCLRSFRQFILHLGRENCRPIRLKQLVLPTVLDIYGQFRIWGDQTKANWPADARGSLDLALRNNKGTKDVVLNILRRLQAQLGQAIPIARKVYDDTLGTDQDSTSSLSSESDASSEEEGCSVSLPFKTSKIAVLMQHISEQIRALQHLQCFCDDQKSGTGISGPRVRLLETCRRSIRPAMILFMFKKRSVNGRERVKVQGKA
jgi:hypothetical protein